MKIIVTGSAGFIGHRVCEFLLDRGDEVIGLDSLDSYYEVSLKKARLAKLKVYPNFTEARIDLADCQGVTRLFRDHRPDTVVNLAAQAGVRHSLVQPHAYVRSNLTGFLNILEGCRNLEIKHLVYASSSSVYGGNTKLPFEEKDGVDHPLSLYAASKRANELMAHSYSHLFGFPSTGLRFFTVYGPWGRPDMALFLFTKAILAGKPINIYNNGNMARSFTYIDDIATGVVRCLDRPPRKSNSGEDFIQPALSETAPFRVLNIGSDQSVSLTKYIDLLELNLGIKAKKNFLPLQPGDVTNTSACVETFRTEIGFEPFTPLEEGIKAFVDWYKKYYESP